MKSVLIIDDDKLVLKTLSAAFEDKGFTTLVAADGKAGLDAALKNQPSLIVTDLKMPEMDGMQMIEKLRADDWGKNVPVVVLSADEQTSTINQALQHGVTVYLSKNKLDATAIAAQIVAAL